MSAKSKFSLQFLGTGNARSKPPINYNTNVLVRSEGMTWLIDCGVLCPLALQVRGLSPFDIDGVFITHLHGDHVLGLEELFLTNYFAANRRIKLLLPDGLLVSHAGMLGCDIWENCLRASLSSNVVFGVGYKQLDFDDFADISVIKPHFASQFGGLRVEVFPVQHVPSRPSYGIILDGRIFYTSDCVFNRAQIEGYFEQGASVVFHDVSFEPPYVGAVHASIDELLTLPKQMAENMVLMHYADATTEATFDRARNHGFRIARCGERFEF